MKINSAVHYLNPNRPPTDDLEHLQYPMWLRQMFDAPQAGETQLEIDRLRFEEMADHMAFGNASNNRQLFYYRGLFHFYTGGLAQALMDFGKFLQQAVFFDRGEVAFQDPQDLPLILTSYLLQALIQYDRLREWGVTIDGFNRIYQTLDNLELLYSLKGGDFPDKYFSPTIYSQAQEVRHATAKLYNKQGHWESEVWKLPGVQMALEAVDRG